LEVIKILPNDIPGSAWTSAPISPENRFYSARKTARAHVDVRNPDNAQLTDKLTSIFFAIVADLQFLSRSRDFILAVETANVATISICRGKPSF
jgi:hypothetical protein